MADRKYFFDTYALYEFVNGNASYKKYFQEYEITTIRLNLIELFYILLKNFNIETARRYYNYFKPFIVDFSDDVLENAMLLKLKLKTRDISSVDCIGYAYALSNNLKFLTGDKEFKNMPNVEFIK